MFFSDTYSWVNLYNCIVSKGELDLRYSILLRKLCLLLQLLLGYLPPDRSLWSTELSKKRSQYKHFKDDLLLNPVSHVGHLMFGCFFHLNFSLSVRSQNHA